MSLHTKKEPTNKEILTKVRQVQTQGNQTMAEVQNLGQRIYVFEVKVDNKFQTIDEKFDVLVGMIDNLAKMFNTMRDEQRAGFANYSRLDTTVEKHDKDIKIIKRHLSIA